MTTLDELRRANLREQRRSADERLAPKEPMPPPRPQSRRPLRSP